MATIDKWVLRTACATLKSWDDDLTRDLQLAVNVGAHQLSGADFVAIVEETLAATGADPKRLVLELTEHVMLDDIEEVVATMRRLKELGVQLRARRFRHRLFVALLSEAAAVRHAEDRPLLRARHRNRSERPRDRPDDPEHRAQHEGLGHRGGRGDADAGAAAAADRLPRVPGLSLRKAEGRSAIFLPDSASTRSDSAPDAPPASKLAVDPDIERCRLSPYRGCRHRHQLAALRLTHMRLTPRDHARRGLWSRTQRPPGCLARFMNEAPDEIRSLLSPQPSRRRIVRPSRRFAAGERRQLRHAELPAAGRSTTSRRRCASTRSPA